MKIYEIDTEHFDVPIKRGATIVKVVLLQDVQSAKRLLKQTIERFVSQAIKDNYPNYAVGATTCLNYIDACFQIDDGDKSG